MLKKLLYTLVALALIAPLAAAQNDGRLIVANVTDIVQLDPTDIGDAPSSLVAGHIMDHLVGRDADGNDVGHLAESWDISDDGLVWTFHLRQGVTFHDGSAFDAEVVKWHFDRVMTGDGPARFRGQWTSVVASVEILDSHTVAFHLNAPNAAFINLVIQTNGGYIMSKQAYETMGAEAFSLAPVGTGPFIFREWVPGQYALLERNPDYFDGPAGVSELMFRPIPEVATQVIELETGGVHIITQVGAEDWERLQSNPNVVAHSVPAYRTRVLRLANTAPFDDALVRQAIQHAANYQLIAEVLVGDMGTPTDDALMPLASWGYIPDLGGASGYDPERALELFAQAGWERGSDGLLRKDGQTFTITLKSPNGRYFADQEISLAVANQWRELGIDVTVQVMEWAPFLDDVYGFSYQAALMGWNQSAPEPSIFTEPLLGTGARGNYGPWSDEAMDALLAQAVAVSDPGARLEIYREMLSLARELAWFVPLYNENKVAAVSAQLEGYVHTPAGDMFETVRFR